MSEVGYIVVGNFTTEMDDVLHKNFNRKSGISDFSFMVLMAEFAQEHDRDITHRFDDSLIMRGTEDHLKQLRRENGDRFSYAFTDEKGLQQFLAAEQEAQEYFALYGVYQSGRTAHEVTASLDA